MNAPSDRKPAAAIIGLGACTALGETAPASAAAVRAAVANMSEWPGVFDRWGDPIVVAAAPHLDPALAGTDRFLALALPAAREAMRPLADAGPAHAPVKVAVGLPEPRPGLPERLEDRISDGLARALAPQRPAEVRTVAAGHAAALGAVQRAWRALCDGDECFYLIGGVDSYLSPETLRWIDRCGRLHSDHLSWGFCPGEAAGFLLLGSRSAALRLRLAAPADVLAAAAAEERNGVGSEAVCTGEGLAAAFRGVFAAVQDTGLKVSRSIGDLNGEPHRAEEYGFAVMRSAEGFAEGADFQTPADCWGDVGAASGPLAAMLAATAIRRGYARGPCALIWASSDGGCRGAALVASAAEAEKDHAGNGQRQ